MHTLMFLQEGLKEYQKFNLADDLGKAYGENTSAPPKGRRAGVLLHPTSLPGAYGVGSIGQEAHAFVDWLASAGMQVPSSAAVHSKDLC